MSCWGFLPTQSLFFEGLPGANRIYKHGPRELRDQKFKTDQSRFLARKFSSVYLKTQHAPLALVLHSAGPKILATPLCLKCFFKIHVYSVLIFCRPCANRIFLNGISLVSGLQIFLLSFQFFLFSR